MIGLIYDSLDLEAKGLANALDQNRVGERVLFGAGVPHRYGFLSQRHKPTGGNFMVGDHCKIIAPVVPLDADVSRHRRFGGHFSIRPEEMAAESPGASDGMSARRRCGRVVVDTYASGAAWTF